MSAHPFEELQTRHDTVSGAFYDAQYEVRVLDHLLVGLGFNKTKTLRVLMERAVSDGNEESEPTLRTFNDEFESFPVLLGCNRLPKAKLHVHPKGQVPALYKSFPQVPFVEAYNAFYTRNQPRANGRMLGLVFPYKGVPWGLIIHNDGMDFQKFHGTCLVYVGGPKKNRECLYVRPFQTFLEALYNRGHGWRPED